MGCIGFQRRRNSPDHLTPMKANFGKLIDIPILYRPAHLLMMKGGKIERNVDCWRTKNGWLFTKLFWMEKACFFISILKGGEGKSDYKMGGWRTSWKISPNTIKSSGHKKSNQTFIKRFPCVKFLNLVVKTPENQFNILIKKCTSSWEIFVEEWKDHKCSKKLRSVRRL